MVRIHALDTGRVMLRRRWLAPDTHDALRFPVVLLDREWSGWLGIWSFAIEHPDGLVIVDAGQDPAFTPPRRDLLTRRAVRFEVTDGDRLEVRLREAGLDPSAVRHHVFTHLHVDHVGTGPIGPPVVQADGWRAAHRPGAHLLGLMYPGFRDPQTVDGDHDLYGDGTIRLLATPGHTVGHQSVLVTPAEGPRVLLTGDVAYVEASLLNSTISAVDLSPRKARRSIDRLRAVCAEAPTIVAPSHDPATAQRIAAGQVTTLDGTAA